MKRYISFVLVIMMLLSLAPQVSLRSSAESGDRQTIVSSPLPEEDAGARDESTDIPEEPGIDGSLPERKVENSDICAGRHIFVDHFCENCGIAEIIGGSFGENVTWELNLVTWELSLSGSGETASYYEASSIPWSQYSEEIQTLTFEGDITSIGNYAFCGCKKLQSVTIPDTVTYIGAFSFYKCESLTELIIPKGVTYIDEAAFYECVGLTELTIPQNVTTIGEWAFGYCSGLTSVNIQTGVTSIGEYGFYCCKNLTHITIPEGVKSIGSSAFTYCTMLSSVIIGKDVATVDSVAFSSCPSLMTVVILNPQCQIYDDEYTLSSPLNTTIFGEVGSTAESHADSMGYSFVPFTAESCKNEEHCFIGGFCYFCEEQQIVTGTCGEGVSWVMNVPNASLRIFGEGKITDFENTSVNPWYSYRPYIQSLYLDNTISGIGSNAFYGCSRLTTVVIPDSVTVIGDYSFSYCDGLTSVSIPNSVTCIGKYSFENCDALTTLTIPDSVVTIDSYGFYHCDNLESVAIGKGVTAIEYMAFDYCLNLKRVDIKDLAAWCKISYSRETGNPLCNQGDLYLNGVKLEHLVIPEGVSQISDYAFYCCNSLKTVTIGADVNTIGELAFYYCKNLESITLGDSVVNVYDRAFYYCSSLKSITFGNGVKRIDMRVFEYCNNLSEMHIRDLRAWCGINFYSSSSNPLYMGAALYLDGVELDEVVIPEGVAYISDLAFVGWKGLTSVTVPNSVSSIGSSAFRYCDNINRVNIQDLTAWYETDFENETSNPLYFGGDLYLNGTKVEEKILPAGITRIGRNALIGWEEVTSVTIPDSVTFVEDSAFKGCQNLNRVDIEDLAAWCAIDFASLSANPLSTGASLYLKGVKLEELVIPEGVTSIGTYGFAGWEDVTKVTVPKCLTSVKNNAFYKCDNLQQVNLVDLEAWFGISFQSSSSNPLYNGGKPYLNGTQLEKLVIPESVTTINSYVFAGWEDLTGVVIPETVAVVNNYAFYYCDNLVAVAVLNPECQIYASSYTLGSSSRTTIFAEAGSTAESFAGSYRYTFVPLGEESCAGGNHCYINGICIGCEDRQVMEGSFGQGFTWTLDGATGVLTISGEGPLPNFSGTSAPWYTARYLIRKVILEDSVTGIGNYAFSYCSTLSEMTIPSSVATIGNYAFYECGNLNSITIPAGVTSVGLGAFSYCDSLKKVIILNPACSIYANGNTLGVSGTTVIRGFDASTAEAYAQQHGYSFAEITECDTGKHHYVETVITPATCKEAGQTLHTCSLCGHRYTEYVSADHVFVGGWCTVCGEEDPDAIKEPTEDKNLVLGHTLDLASDISINFAVEKSLLSDYDMDTVYVESTVDVYNGNTKTGTRAIRIRPMDNGSYYYFTLSGLTAIQMNDKISTVLYGIKDGKQYYSPTDEYSLADYAYSQLNKPSRPYKLRALCADFLRYGAKAQIYKSYRTDMLADSAMTEEHKACLSDIDAVTFGNTDLILDDLPDAPITWVGKTLSLESKVCIKFIFTPTNYTGELSDLTLRMTYEGVDGETKSLIVDNGMLYNEERNFYAFTLDSLLAPELRTVVSVQIFDGENPVSSTRQYSADTYGNGKDGTLLDLCKALFAYSDSAKFFSVDSRKFKESEGIELKGKPLLEENI